MLCATSRRQLLVYMRKKTHLCFSLISYILFSPQWRSPGCLGAAPWQDLMQNYREPENAFVTLNPCHVSVDDIIVWEHITSPLPRLSLLKTAPPYVYWAAHTYAHTYTCTGRFAYLFTNVISISACILITVLRLDCMCRLTNSYCVDVIALRTASMDMANSINVLNSYKLKIRCNNIQFKHIPCAMIKLLLLYFLMADIKCITDCICINSLCLFLTFISQTYMSAVGWGKFEPHNAHNCDLWKLLP